MRRFDKKKIIQEANLRLENERLFEKMTLNEIGDEPFPYEFTESSNDFSYIIEFKVPKDDESSEDSFYNMKASYSMYHTPSNRSYPDIKKLAIDLGYKNEELPDNLFSIYITFGVLNEDKTLEFPELKSKYVFKTMATVQSAALEIIKKNISYGKVLLMIFSHPMGGGKGGDLREKLYNLYYDMQIKKNPEMFGDFNKWSVGPYAGIVNTEVINGNLIPPKPIFRGLFLLTTTEYSGQIYNDIIDYYETTIKNSGLNAKINSDDANVSFKYITLVIRDVTAEELKDMFIDFKNKKGIELSRDNGATMEFHDKRILNINDLNNIE